MYFPWPSVYIYTVTNQNMNIKITAKNAFTKLTELEFAAPLRKEDNVDNIHRILSEGFPDCFVNISMSDGSFIAGQPHNMAKDGELWKEGRISWEEYATKWCPNVL
jgi:hypothetical protein